MTLEEYAAWAVGAVGAGLADRPDDQTLTDVGLALVGDAGEVVECLRKLAREGERQRERLAGELGDVWHYWTRQREHSRRPADAQPGQDRGAPTLRLVDLLELALRPLHAVRRADHRRASCQRPSGRPGLPRRIDSTADRLLAGTEKKANPLGRNCLALGLLAWRAVETSVPVQTGAPRRESPQTERGHDMGSRAIWT